MKIFISWSGETSFKVAKVLKEWLPCVIEDVEPYFSSEDIDKGARWSTDIAEELENASFGILCVTKDNLESQWLNFEAGALSKAVDKSKVCPLLFHLKPSDITNSPILQFQMTNVEKQDILKLFKSINASLGDSSHDETRLEKVFDAFWPQMEKDFNSIIYPKEDDVKKANEDRNMEIFEEMLDLLRSQQMMLKNPERLFPVGYVQEVLRYSQMESNKIIRNVLPSKAIMDLEHTEMELNKIFSNISKYDDESIERIKSRVGDYILMTKRIFKYIGISSSNYVLFHDEE